MKLKTVSLAALSAITIAGSAQATTLLLSDNFNDTPNENSGSFNANLASTQSGSLGTVSYTVTDGGYAWSTQHSNGGRMLIAGHDSGASPDARVSLNHNFATVGGPLEIKFNLSVTDGSIPQNWVSIAIGSAQNPFVNDTTNRFSSLFRDNGGTQQFAGATNLGDSNFSFTDGASITLLLSDAAGTGTAFNGNGTSVVKMYVNDVLQSTFTGLNFGSNDGYISFQGYGAKGYYDDLTITLVPEPSAALLGGLGLLALLRRRR